MDPRELPASLKDLVFITEYVQDYKKVTVNNEQHPNIFIVPDESFEVDLDNNFSDAYRVIRKLKDWIKSVDKADETVKQVEDNNNIGEYTPFTEVTR